MSTNWFRMWLARHTTIETFVYDQGFLAQDHRCKGWLSGKIFGMWWYANFDLPMNPFLGSEEFVRNLQSTADYLREDGKEKDAIIKQLSEGPGDVEYIHPLDLMELINSVSSDDAIDIYRNPGQSDQCGAFEYVVVASTGKKYKQSIHMPKRTKAIV